MIIWLALILGLLTGYMGYALSAAMMIAEMCMRIMRLLSVPVIFFALLTTFLSLGNLKRLGGRVLFYTTLTTLTSATIALCLYRIIQPSLGIHTLHAIPPTLPKTDYTTFVLNMVPQNWIEPFLKGDVMAVMLLALALGSAFLSLPNENRVALRLIVESFFKALMILIKWFVRIMPLAVWAFMVVLMHDIQGYETWSSLASYLSTVAGANLIHGFIALPFLLVIKGINPLSMLRSFAPALSFAFFSKSSVATLPIAVDCAIKRGVNEDVARFCYPLCTSINMNACAGFILITIMFVASHHGIQFSLMDQIFWVFFATLAAIGNAGVPMGCFFLASSLLSLMGVPLHLMGLILPFYTLLDMLETAINIWSDSCVTVLADQEMNKQDLLSTE